MFKKLSRKLGAVVLLSLVVTSYVVISGAATRRHNHLPQPPQGICGGSEGGCGGAIDE